MLPEASTKAQAQETMKRTDYKLSLVDSGQPSASVPTLPRIAFMMLAAFSLASCSSDDDNKDIVEQVTIYVSAETGTYNVVPDNTLEEGMMIRIDHEYYICVAFNTIEGFTYERGHEYELLVKRTTLANPPQDSGKYRYELVRIVSDKKIE